MFATDSGENVSVIAHRSRICCCDFVAVGAAVVSTAEDKHIRMFATETGVVNVIVIVIVLL